ncbi:MAG: methyltransferase [Bacteroidales bacterium]|nr:methyltransferase [Bacteroidales bacterium]
MAFRFKQFSVDDTGCPMKVGTDSVLLGAWASLENSRTILDIGTGCGLLALIAAQRSVASITAIEIDPVAAEVAAANFKRSPWSERLEAICISLQEYLKEGNPGLFDHIISNPPYFINSLKAPGKERSNARHTDLLPYEVITEAVSKLLAPEGCFSLILPCNESAVFKTEASKSGLQLTAEILVVPKEGKSANRALLEFSKLKQPVRHSTLMIRNANGEYTEEYKMLTSQFYLNF